MDVRFRHFMKETAPFYLGRLSLKIQQLDVLIETKTLDDVFVRLKVSR